MRLVAPCVFLLRCSRQEKAIHVPHSKDNLMKKLLFISAILLFVFACATEPSRPPRVIHPEFTRQRITQLQTGLTPNQIQSFFGLPDRTATVRLGTQTPNPWNALVYEYDMGNPLANMPSLYGLTPEEVNSVYSTAIKLRESQGQNLTENVNRFYFSLDYNPPLLAYWSINRAY